MRKLFSFFDSHGFLKRIVKVGVDFVISFVSFFVICKLVCGHSYSFIPPTSSVAFCSFVFSVIIVLAWLISGKYYFLWRGSNDSETSREIVASIGAVIVMTVITYLVRKTIGNSVPYIPKVDVVIFSTTIVFIISRWVKKFSLLMRKHYNGGIRATLNKKILIVGAGWAGNFAISSYQSGEKAGRPVVIVDDDEQKQNQRLSGVPVKGKFKDIPALVEKYDISEIVIAVPSLQGDKLSELVNMCKKTKKSVTIMSKAVSADIANNESPIKFRELNIADFLSRDEVQLDTESISSYITGKRIMVTGGGGSIGSELCRQIVKFDPELIIIFDIYENSAYELQQELIRTYGKNVQIKVLIGSIRDKQRLDEVFETEEPSIVFHAAAHKHVPLMEDSPAEAIKNNVLGTYNLIRSASEHGVERFVQISTDKAVNPTNVMGATKRMCEMILQCFSKKTEMKCMAVRFGNVLGSHGSVIPLFEAQIKNGGPVTVTHPDIIRYFMTIPEAAQLVLQAGSSDKSGEIYVLDMGEPVRIKDLAENLIRFYGYEPDVDMKIVYTGLRPGEKLYEELLMDEEEDKMGKTGYEKIFVAHPLDFDESILLSQIEELSKSAEHNDLACVKALASVVTTFHPDYERIPNKLK